MGRRIQGYFDAYWADKDGTQLVKPDGTFVGVVTTKTNPDGSTSPVWPALADDISNGRRVGANVYPFNIGTTVFNSDLLDMLAKDVWELRVAALLPGNTYQANIGNVVYIDPTAVTNGAGTFSSPRNNLPAFASNQTLLLKGGTTIGPIGLGAYTNWLLGSYDPLTGLRTFDPDKMATIDAAGGIGVNMSGATVNMWVSGVKVTNYTTGILRGRNAGASGGGVEFCVAGNAVYGNGRIFIQNLVRGATLRFNKADGIGADGLWHGECLNSSGATNIYGNFISLNTDDTIDGPDALQINILNGEASGAITAHTNYFKNPANRKQVIIAAYANATALAGDSFTGYHNVCLGADTALPSHGGALQNGVYLSFPLVDWHENYVKNSRYPIVVQNANPVVVAGSRIVGNIIVVDMNGPMRMGIEANTAIGAAKITVCNNTIIGISCGGSDISPATPIPAIQSLRSADIVNNVIVGNIWGYGINVNASQSSGVLVTTNNAFDSRIPSFYRDNAAGFRAVSLSDFVGVENWLDSFARPIIGSPLDNGGAAWFGATPSADVFGRALDGLQMIGAVYPIRQK